MNLQSIKYLAALAQFKHFGKAAKMCFVSQPTLSMQIKKLEDYLGVQLLERTNKIVHLTPIGITLSQHADIILQELHTFREIAKEARDPFKGELKIGIIPTLAPYLLPRIIAPLKKKFSEITYLFFEKQTEFLIEDLKKNRIDTAILALPIFDNGLHAHHFYKEDFLLALSPDHDLVKRKFVREDDLFGQSLLLLDEGHCLRDQALELCHKVNATENQDFRATSLETLRHIIGIRGKIATLMPKLACKKNDGIIYLEFKGKKPTRDLGYVWRKSTGRSLLLNALVDYTTKILSNSV